MSTSSYGRRRALDAATWSGDSRHEAVNCDLCGKVISVRDNFTVDDDGHAHCAVHCAGSQPASDTPDPRDEVIRLDRLTSAATAFLNCFNPSKLDAQVEAQWYVLLDAVMNARAALSKGEGAEA